MKNKLNKIAKLREKEGSISINMANKVFARIIILYLITTFSVNLVMGRFNLSESDLKPNNIIISELPQEYYYKDYEAAAIDFNKLSEKYLGNTPINTNNLAFDFSILSNDCDRRVTIDDVMNTLADMSIIMDNEAKELINDSIGTYLYRENNNVNRADIFSFVYLFYMKNPSQITIDLVGCRMGLLSSTKMEDIEKNLLRLKQIAKQMLVENKDEQSSSIIKLFNILLLAKTLSLANSIEYHVGLSDNNENYLTLDNIQDGIDAIISSGKYNELLDSAVREINSNIKNYSM